MAGSAKRWRPLPTSGASCEISAPSFRSVVQLTSRSCTRTDCKYGDAQTRSRRGSSAGSFRGRGSSSAEEQEAWSVESGDEQQWQRDDALDYADSRAGERDQDKDEFNENVTALALLQELQGLMSQQSRRQVLAQIRTLKVRDASKRPSEAELEAYAAPEDMQGIRNSSPGKSVARSALPTTPQRYSASAGATSPHRTEAVASDLPQRSSASASASSPQRAGMTTTAASTLRARNVSSSGPSTGTAPQNVKTTGSSTPHRQSIVSTSGTPQRNSRVTASMTPQHSSVASNTGTPQRPSTATVLSTPERRSRGRDSASSSVKQSPYAAQHNYFLRYVGALCDKDEPTSPNT
jgi:hypothetical protein